MSEQYDNLPDPMVKVTDDAWACFYECVLRRDESMVTPEVMRVAKALCHANGGAVDVLVISGRPCPNRPNGCDSYRIFASNVCMAWTPYVGQAVCAIANLERHREESYDNETAKATPDLKAVDIPVGFSGMNDADDAAQKRAEIEKVLGKVGMIKIIHGQLCFVPLQ